jgi:hypothetical protein
MCRAPRWPAQLTWTTQSSTFLSCTAKNSIKRSNPAPPPRPAEDENKVSYNRFVTGSRDSGVRLAQGCALCGGGPRLPPLVGASPRPAPETLFAVWRPLPLGPSPSLTSSSSPPFSPPLSSFSTRRPWTSRPASCTSQGSARKPSSRQVRSSPHRLSRWLGQQALLAGARVDCQPMLGPARHHNRGAYLRTSRHVLSQARHAAAPQACTSTPPSST